MKVASSTFLQEKKPLLQALLRRLLQTYSYASLLGVDSNSVNYSVNKTGMGILEDDLWTSRGFVAKVLDRGRYAEYSFNQIEEDSLEGIVSEIESLVSCSSATVPEGMEENVYPSPEEEKNVFSGSTEYACAPEEMGDDNILAALTAVKEKAFAMDTELLDCSVSCSYQRSSRIFLSREKDLEQNTMWTTGSIFVMAAKGEEVKNYYKSFSNLGGMELLSRMEAGVEECVRVVRELLESEPMVPGEYTCICSPDVTGMIVHEAFGHGVEMDMFVKKRALAEKYIGEYVASPLVTMHDGAATIPQTATYFFDDEGTMAHDTVVIDKGILKTGISDLQSALLLGTEPTGNGRRESFERKAYTRMTNTYFEGGSDKVEDMIASVDYGFLLENPSSGMEDPKNWGIQCMVNIAREIRGGKLTGRIFSPIVLTGYVPDLLKSITAMSENVVLDGGGMCGKGWKEWVKVSDGGPFIKARIRLG